MGASLRPSWCLHVLLLSQFTMWQSVKPACFQRTKSLELSLQHPLLPQKPGWGTCLGPETGNSPTARGCWASSCSEPLVVHCDLCHPSLEKSWMGGQDGECRTDVSNESAWQDPGQLFFITRFLSCLEIGLPLFPVLGCMYYRVRK